MTVARWSKTTAALWAVVALIMIVGAILRVKLDEVPLNVPANNQEAMRVAQSFALNGSFSDAYFIGQGPTAHFTPVMPMLASIVYKLTMHHYRTNTIAFVMFALCQVTAAYLVLFQTFRRRWGWSTALAGLSIVTFPLFANLETQWFQYWDGALCTLMSASVFLLVIGNRNSRFRLARMVFIAVILAVLTFTNQIVGVASCAWVFVMLFGRDNKALTQIAALCALALAAMVTPWALRNKAELGKAIPFRSNLNLEVALGLYPGGIPKAETAGPYFDRMLAIHPTVSPASQARVRNEGEAGYFADLGQETRKWVGSHPRDAAKIAVRHVREYVFPPRWQFITEWFGNAAPYIYSTVFLLGLAGLACHILLKERFAYATLAFVIVSALPFIAVQPLPRYAYSTYCILCFWAGVLLHGIATWILRVSRTQPPGLPSASLPLPPPAMFGPSD